MSDGSDPHESGQPFVFGSSEPDNLIRVKGRPAIWFSECTEQEEPDENCKCDWCESKRALASCKALERESVQENRVRRRF